MTEIVMPRLSDSMEEGTITSWLKQTGDHVRAGEEIVEIETDKATMTYEAEVAGVLTTLVETGATVALGAPIALMGGVTATPKAEPEAAPVERPAAPASATAASNGAAAGQGRRPSASPLARRIAADVGVDLNSLSGSGPGGRIIKADVEAAAAGSAAPAAPGTAVEPATTATAKGDLRVEELSRLQQIVARRMSEAKATAPDFALNVEVDMESALAMRETLKHAVVQDGVVPSLNDIVVMASARALRESPRANGSYRDGRFELHERVNVGIAVAAEDALVVPVIADADRKGLGQIAIEARRLAGKVRDGKITPPELAGGTFTVSNLGMYGISSFTAVISIPQAAILAVGAIEPKPVVDADGSIVVRRRMAMTLTCDHRILYGADAAEFLSSIKKTIENPLRLLL